jgi:predicted Fe-S protein YdhL (DUF1289 family)
LADKLPARIPTPCIGVCSTGIGDAVCRGCKRFSHEVIDWNGYTDAQKRAICARLDQLLAQIVAAKLTIFDVGRLESQLRAQRVRYSAHRGPAMWVFELLRAGARQIDDTHAFGFVVEPSHRHLALTELREQIDREFFILSEAHYERYIGGRLEGRRAP